MTTIHPISAHPSPLCMDIETLVNEHAPKISAERTLAGFYAARDRADSIAADFCEHALVHEPLRSRDREVRLHGLLEIAHGIRVFKAADLLDNRQAKKLFDRCRKRAGFRLIDVSLMYLEFLDRVDPFGVFRRERELRYEQDGTAEPVTLPPCGYVPFSDWACPRCPDNIEDLMGVERSEHLRTHGVEHIDHFRPTEPYLDRFTDFEARVEDAHFEPTVERAAAVAELVIEAGQHMNELLAVAARTPELHCAVKLHRLEAAQDVAYVLARYVGAGIGDPNTVTNTMRQVARVAKLSADDEEALVAQVRDADGGWLREVVLAAKREAQAEINQLSALYDPVTAVRVFPTAAGDRRLASKRCRHELVLPNAEDRSIAKCMRCDWGGSVPQIWERHFGFSYDTQPVELLDAIKRDIYGDATSAESIADRIQPVTDFLDGPDPEYLIDDVMLLATICVVFGLSTAGKSFLVIDQALCIASGRPWHGHKVKRSKVLFVVGESTAGYRARIRAWCKKNGVVPASLDGWVGVMPCSVNLYDPNGDVGAFVQAVNDKGYDVIVFDTLSRMMGDADDNSAHDFNVILNNTRDVNGMCWYVHHTTKDGATYRGSGNIMAASDTMILCVIDKDKVVTVSCFKQKEGEDFAPMRFQITPEGTSAVLVPVTIKAGAVRLSASEQKVVDALKTGPKTPKEMQLCSGLPKSTVTRALRALVAKDVVERDGTRYTL